MLGEELFIDENFFSDQINKINNLLKTDSSEKILIGELFDKTKIYYVDGNWVRDHIETDFTIGGSHYSYEKIPKNELWIENTRTERDKSFNMLHVVFEYTLIKHGNMSESKAHNYSQGTENLFRKIFKA